ANASKTIVQSGIALRGPRKELVAVNVDSPREFPSSYLGFHSAAAGFPAALDSLPWSKVSSKSTMKTQRTKLLSWKRRMVESADSGISQQFVKVVFTQKRFSLCL